MSLVIRLIKARGIIGILIIHFTVIKPALSASHSEASANIASGRNAFGDISRILALQKKLSRYVNYAAGCRNWILQFN